jgi:hypothetical protein
MLSAADHDDPYLLLDRCASDRRPGGGELGDGLTKAALLLKRQHEPFPAENGDWILQELVAEPGLPIDAFFQTSKVHATV